jgi:dephospho-CoA kinase
MLTVGLTGGIATGKSYILQVLAELRCETIDADAVAHQVMEQGQPAYQEIVEHFGPDVVDDRGVINRVKLGAIVFADRLQREKLNSIVHPRVYEAQRHWLAEVAARNAEAIAVVDAALMIETGSYRRFDKLIVAYCDPQIQLDRLMARNHLSMEQARARIAAQMSSEEKLKFADYAIDTSKGFDDTRRQVEEIYAALQQFSDERRDPRRNIRL